MLILILYEHLISFTQSLDFLCNDASLRNAELVRKEIENNTWARVDMEFLFECSTGWI